MKFIYVMKKKYRDALLKGGYSLIKEDEENSLWIFENSDELKFSVDEECPQIVYSDILSF